ncbi:hypothetical protein ACFV4N_38605 [Actinosynnema sp. NPDC059797]
MSTTLPPERDLPPRRHARIRAELERAVAGRRRVRYAPLLTAGVAAAAVIGLVVVVAPWQGPVGDDAAAPPSLVTTGSAPGTTGATGPAPGTTGVSGSANTTTTTTEAGAMSVPGLDPGRVAEVEQGCVETFQLPGPAVLHQYVADVGGGDLALLYTPDGVLECTVNGPTTPYNPAFTAVRDRAWLPGPFSADAVGVSSGGAHGKAAHWNVPGVALAVGRVSPAVARVVYEREGRSVEAEIANGTYVAHLEYPPDFVAPSDGGLGVLTAYDDRGRRLGRITSADVTDPAGCWLLPGGAALRGPAGPDSPACAPAVPWR